MGIIAAPKTGPLPPWFVESYANPNGIIRHRIIRRADGKVMRDGFVTRRQANQALIYVENRNLPK